MAEKPKKYPINPKPYILPEKDIPTENYIPKPKPYKQPAPPPIEGNLYDKIILVKGDKGSRGRKAASSAEKG